VFLGVVDGFSVSIAIVTTIVIVSSELWPV